MNIISNLPSLLSGILITLVLMLCSTCIGFVLAILMTIGSYSDSFIAKRFVGFVVFFVRGTPLLVQLFLIYYGAGQFEWIRDSSVWIILREPMACAIIALSINTACYTTILFQGAIHSVPQNEVDATAAMGMSKWLAFRRIIFPLAIRLTIPAYSNEVVMILKGTSLASTITLMDLMGVTQHLISQTYTTLEFYLFAALVYLIINGLISGIFNFWIKKSSIQYLAR